PSSNYSKCLPNRKMTKPNFGPIVKKRTHQLLEAIFRLFNNEINKKYKNNLQILQIQWDSKNDNRLVIETKIQFLEVLTKSCDYTLTRTQIKESLHRLEDLGILEDHRFPKKGPDMWHFSLNLWHPFSHQNLNLDRLSEEWENYKAQIKKHIPITPQQYNEQGITNYIKGDIAQAIQNFEKAISLDYDYTIAHYNLGSIYDELQYFETASQAYLKASLGGLCVAYNNLGRLYILQEQYTTAIHLLLIGLEKATLDQEQEIFSLYKNLGWARFKQKRYHEAETYLLQALDIDSKRGSVYGLLGQIWEALGKSEQGQSAYQNCLRYASIYRPEEDEWLQLAREKCQNVN
ncbi:MAG: tetratricopeptide repeat protein, partial [Xenococcus sp. (in: cyanobacteria)]